MLLNDPILVRITAKGQPLELSLGVQVLNFSYEDAEKGDDMLNITFADPFHRLVDSEQFVENTEWTVQWGFPTKMCAPRKVLVKRPKFRYGEVEVEALDKGSALRIEENWTVYKSKPMKEIISELAQKNQLTPVVDPELTAIIQFLACAGRTDYEVLQYLESRAEDHVFKITSDKLFFEKRKLDGPPKGTFEYAPGRDSRLLSFEITVKDQDNAKSAKQTTTVGVDPMSFKKVIYKADESTTQSANLGDRRPQDKYTAGFTKNIPGLSQLTNGGKASAVTQGNSTGKSIILPPKTEEESKAIAQSKRRKAMLDSVEASFEIVASPADPFYTSGDLIEVRNIGKKFSGSWQIVKITHDLSEGYIYKMTCKRNAVNSTSTSKPSPLNGAINKKNPVNPAFQKVNAKVTGSTSGAEYGSDGRRISG